MLFFIVHFMLFSVQSPSPSWGYGRVFWMAVLNTIRNRRLPKNKVEHCSVRGQGSPKKQSCSENALGSLSLESSYLWSCYDPLPPRPDEDSHPCNGQFWMDAPAFVPTLREIRYHVGDPYGRCGQWPPFFRLLQSILSGTVRDQTKDQSLAVLIGCVGKQKAVQLNGCVGVFCNESVAVIVGCLVDWNIHSHT